MTHVIYSHQQLQQKSIAGLKQLYTSIGCTVEITNRYSKNAWVAAIAQHQAQGIYRIAPAGLDEQALAQAELNQHIAQQAIAIAPEELAVKEISFYKHEYYCGTQLIATISYDDDLTQPWVVTVSGKEKFRANNWAKCHRFIQWHHQDESLNEEFEAEAQGAGDKGETTPHLAASSTSENRIMAHIFTECQKYGFKILDDGIYKNDIKLGQVGCTNGNWWVALGSYGQPQYSYSVFDAVKALLVIEELTDAEVDDCEPEEWGQLFVEAFLVTA